MLYEVTWLPHCPIRLVYSLCMDEPGKGDAGRGASLMAGRELKLHLWVTGSRGTLP